MVDKTQFVNTDKFKNVFLSMDKTLTKQVGFIEDIRDHISMQTELEKDRAEQQKEALEDEARRDQLNQNDEVKNSDKPKQSIFSKVFGNVKETMTPSKLVGIAGLTFLAPMIVEFVKGFAGTLITDLTDQVSKNGFWDTIWSSSGLTVAALMGGVLFTKGGRFGLGIALVAGILGLIEKTLDPDGDGVADFAGMKFDTGWLNDPLIIGAIGIVVTEIAGFLIRFAGNKVKNIAGKLFGSLSGITKLRGNASAKSPPEPSKSPSTAVETAEELATKTDDASKLAAVSEAAIATEAADAISDMGAFSKSAQAAKKALKVAGKFAWPVTLGLGAHEIATGEDYKNMPLLPAIGTEAVASVGGGLVDLAAMPFTAASNALFDTSYDVDLTGAIRNVGSQLFSYSQEEMARNREKQAAAERELADRLAKNLPNYDGVFQDPFAEGADQDSGTNRLERSIMPAPNGSKLEYMQGEAIQRTPGLSFGQQSPNINMPVFNNNSTQGGSSITYNYNTMITSNPMRVLDDPLPSY